MQTMTVTEGLAPSPTETIEFHALKNDGVTRPIEGIVTDLGVVYVTSITRDGCTGCMEQKPHFRSLATSMSAKYPGLVRFTNVHIRYQQDRQQESWEAKRTFGHAAYPTYMVHIKSHLGPLEVYRSIYPTMDELEKQAADAIQLGEYYKTEAGKTQSSSKRLEADAAVSA